MTREERIALHTKEARKNVKKGFPRKKDLKDGVAEVRKTPQGLIEYVKHNNVLYKKQLDKA